MLRRSAARIALALLALVAGHPSIRMAASAAPPTPSGAAILVYHRFGPAAGATTVSDAVLDEQLAWLASHARVAPLREVLDGLRDASAPTRPCVAITADDGHRSIYTDLYPRIRRFRLPVTLFIYPSAISNASYALTWQELGEMAASGLVDVQSHTVWHPNFHQEKARRSPADYHDFVALQLGRSRQIIEAKLGRTVDMLAWPFGIDDTELNATATAAGYRAGFVLGNRIALSGQDALALPRIWISDGDRSARLAALVGPACGETRGHP